MQLKGQGEHQSSMAEVYVGIKVYTVLWYASSIPINVSGYIVHIIIVCSVGVFEV